MGSGDYMTQRYFKTSSDQVYEAVRTHLNEQWGLPNDLGTATCFASADNGIRDESNALCLAVSQEWCDHADVAAILPTLLSSGDVEEIDQQMYLAVLPSSPF